MHLYISKGAPQFVQRSVAHIHGADVCQRLEPTRHIVKARPHFKRDESPAGYEHSPSFLNRPHVVGDDAQRERANGFAARSVGKRQLRRIHLAHFNVLPTTPRDPLRCRAMSNIAGVTSTPST